MMKESEIEGEIDVSEINKSLYKTCKSICKIIVSNQISSGFLIKLYRGKNQFYCLMANKHFITKEMIKKKETIDIFYNNEKNKKVIKLDNEERYIKDYTDLGIEVLIIEIIEKDNINEDSFLLPDLEYINGYEKYKNKEIYIPQYLGNEELNYSKGKIKEINKYEFSYSSNTNKGASGSPIFIEGRKKVIGIHKQDAKDNGDNYGIFIGPIIELLNKENSITQGKIVFNENGNYYIGHIFNGTAHGKGIIYYKNGSILYEGDFVNGKYEGNGKEIYENGTYYIGQFLNVFRHGKVVLYYQNNSILYEGDFDNDIFEGNGKLIYENGNYFIGQFMNGLAHGKGKAYNKYGSIVYEGDFANDKFEGNGKEIYDNGNYYIGQFLNGLKHGKGTIYNKNGSILYKGDFVNDHRKSNCLIF